MVVLRRWRVASVEGKTVLEVGVTLRCERVYVGTRETSFVLTIRVYRSAKPLVILRSWGIAAIEGESALRVGVA